MKETEIAATLTDAHYDLLVGISVSGFAVGVLSADVGFIYFDRAIHHRTFYFLHGGPDAMAEIPAVLFCPSQFETLWVSIEASPRLRGPSQFDNCGAILRQLSGLQNKKPRLLGGVCLICCLPLSLQFRSASRFAWRRNRCR